MEKTDKTDKTDKMDRLAKLEFMDKMDKMGKMAKTNKRSKITHDDLSAEEFPSPLKKPVKLHHLFPWMHYLFYLHIQNNLRRLSYPPSLHLNPYQIDITKTELVH